ncbi:MAG: helix-turn-helix transcriptional regulator, partial [Clostridia bacterium]|nr:helix-turn-helix transcriptional regulator [Clostridia bacterium]
MDTNNSLQKLSEVAARIKELRDIMGWSIIEMAEKTDVSEEVYNSYESGQVDIPFSFIHKCALAFNVELTELLEGNTAKLSSYTVTRKG